MVKGPRIGHTMAWLRPMLLDAPDADKLPPSKKRLADARATLEHIDRRQLPRVALGPGLLNTTE